MKGPLPQEIARMEEGSESVHCPTDHPQQRSARFFSVLQVADRAVSELIAYLAKLQSLLNSRLEQTPELPSEPIRVEIELIRKEIAQVHQDAFHNAYHKVPSASSAEPASQPVLPPQEVDPSLSATPEPEPSAVASSILARSEQLQESASRIAIGELKYSIEIVGWEIHVARQSGEIEVDDPWIEKALAILRDLDQEYLQDAAMFSNALRSTDPTDAAKRLVTAQEALRHLQHPQSSADQLEAEAALEQFRSWAKDFYMRCNDLQQQSHRLDLRELLLQIEILAFEGRIEQDKYQRWRNRPGWSAVFSRTRLAFGALSATASKLLSPDGIRARGLVLNDRGDWQSMLIEANQRLEVVREELAKEHQLAQQRQSAAKLEEHAREAAVQGARNAVRLAIAALRQESTQEALVDLSDCISAYVSQHRADDWLAAEIAGLRVLVDPLTLIEGKMFRGLRKKVNVLLERQAPSPNLQFSEHMQDDSLDDDSEVDSEDEETGDRESQYVAYRNLYHGLRGMMAGGKRKVEAERSIREFFGFTEFKWVETNRAMHSRVLTSPVDNKRVDVVVIVARFFSKHLQDALRESCKRAGIPCLTLGHGYGVGAIVRAIEEMKEANRISA